MRFARLDLYISRFRCGDENVEPGGAFKRRPVGDINESAPILEGIFPLALGDIQCDRSRSPIQLILDITKSHRAFKKPREPSNECNRLPIKLQLFMIKPKLLRHLHNSRFLSESS